MRIIPYYPLRQNQLCRRQPTSSANDTFVVRQFAMANERSGSSRPSWSRPTLVLVRCCSNSGQTIAAQRTQRCANSGQTHRSKQHLYPITSSAMESSPSGASLQIFSAALARVNRRTHAWIRLRAAALQRDGYTCAVPGWGNATHVDHVVSRRSGGLDNLRSLLSLSYTHLTLPTNREV